MQMDKNVVKCVKVTPKRHTMKHATLLFQVNEIHGHTFTKHNTQGIHSFSTSLSKLEDQILKNFVWFAYMILTNLNLMWVLNFVLHHV